MIKQFLKYLIIGGMAFLIDVVLYFILTRLVDVYYVYARIVSIIAALAWNFWANRQFTFKPDKKHYGQLVKYSLVTLVISVANILLMRLAVEGLKAPDLASIIIITGLLSLVSFAFHKFWTFKT